MPRVVRFDVAVDQPERAIKFYSGVFEWKFEKPEGLTDYWLVSTGEEGQPGIDGSLVQRRYPTDATTLWINVPSVDDLLKKIAQHGGKSLTGKVAVPGVGYYAYCQDTEGNLFGIFQPDGQAV